MADNRDLNAEDLHTRILEMEGSDPSDRTLWDERHLGIFELVTSTMEPRFRRPADRWDPEIKRISVMRAFNFQFFKAEPQFWPLETRAVRSLRTAIRYQF